MIGERLTELRKSRNMKQQVLADALSMSLSTISAYERNVNEPDDPTKVEIAKIFNVSLNFLFGAIDEKIPLNREDAVELPVGFPVEKKAEVYKYVDYLMYNENKDGESES